MKYAATLIAVAALAVAATPAIAQDDLPDWAKDLPPIQHTDPKPVKAPKKAKKMTAALAKAHTQARADKEMADTSKWPAGETYDTVYGCKVLTKRKGRCDYRLRYSVSNGVGEAPTMTWCERRVTVRIAKKTRRVSSKVADLDCHTE